ncbi:DUF6053 domain-containing protein [Lysobacter enzymogenes]|uniref:DUF6053 domain-containing protein n=1 Tax=Lysobacter enzymogenes TaxID=69 RepID=UPI003D18BB78
MGGASAPTLSCQVAATSAESVGTQALLRQTQKPAPENDRPRTGRGRRSYSAEATLGCCCAGGVW